jgi:hypothetical protein
MSEWWAPAIFRPLGSGLVLLATLGLLAAGIYGVTQCQVGTIFARGTDRLYWASRLCRLRVLVQADFDDSRLVPVDSYLHAGYAVRERLFSGQGLVVEVHTREINHFLALPALAALDADLAGNPYVHSTRSWWRDFAAYFRTNPALNASLTADGLPTNPRNLFQWTQSFLATATGRQYLGDIVLSSSAIITTQVSTVEFCNSHGNSECGLHLRRFTSGCARSLRGAIVRLCWATCERASRR